MTAMAARPRIFTLVQVAYELQVSIKTIRRWIARGDLITHRFGRQLRVSEADYKIFVAQHRG